MSEAGGEVWETQEVQDQLEDEEAGQQVEMMEGVEESQDLSMIRLHPEKKRKRTKKSSKQDEGANIAMNDRTKHYDREGAYIPI